MLQKNIIFDYTLPAYTNSIFSIDLSMLLSVLLCKIRTEKMIQVITSHTYRFNKIQTAWGFD